MVLALPGAEAIVAFLHERQHVVRSQLVALFLGKHDRVGGFAERCAANERYCSRCDRGAQETATIDSTRNLTLFAVRGHERSPQGIYFRLVWQVRCAVHRIRRRRTQTWDGVVSYATNDRVAMRRRKARFDSPDAGIPRRRSIGARSACARGRYGFRGILRARKNTKMPATNAAAP